MYRILIADDEPMIRKGLQKLVEQSGQSMTSIRTAENGFHALQQIQEERPDFVFTDIRMPKMDGLELCRQLAELDSDIQIVVISGYGDFEYAQKCLSYGVKEYLLKPVSKKAVHDVLDKLVRVSARQRTDTFVPVSRLEQWIAEMDDLVWSLREPELELLLEKLRKELHHYSLKLARFCDVLEELNLLLAKRLSTRDVFSLQTHLDLGGARDVEEAWSRFAEGIWSIVRDLKARRKGRAKDPVEEAKHYIEEHLAEEVSLEEVAEYIGLNASYFSQLFKQSTQETFVQYRTRRRMEKAKKLLQQPHYRITDISGEVGYADHPHFTKTFKKYTGFLPSEYRQNLGIE
ncbi:response regulator [Paenibacillus filicis]|uniref:Response regulator n=1 Tax=Paenibacillus gyeongsangnamensis TaxID=3388067 RepID=A0ABT4Q3E1_9BACL|nr:response regulator [Paenibacillus filicis]MCZ8511352.1 response regulator [Paenibacillus filicis]